MFQFGPRGKIVNPADPNKPSPPQVSILIPTWNGEAWLRDTIESVLNQSFRDFELIITDDASDDNTVSIAREYLRDPRVSVYPYDQNLGLGGNWNRGLSLARGTCLKVLCQDDILTKECLARCVEILKTTPSVSLITSFGNLIGDREATRGLDVIPGSGELQGRWAQEKILHRGNWVGAPTAVMFRRTELERTGYFDDSLACGLDWEMWMRLLTFGNLFVIPEPLYATRIHSGQESVRCMRNLGFERDRVTVVSRMREETGRYGRWTRDETESVWYQSVRSLIRATVKRKEVSLTDTIRFLNRYQSPVRTLEMAARLLIRMGWDTLFKPDRRYPTKL